MYKMYKKKYSVGIYTGVYLLDDISAYFKDFKNKHDFWLDGTISDNFL